MKTSTLLMMLLEDNHEADDIYAGYLLYDTFTDANGTNPSDHTPEKGDTYTEVDTGSLVAILSNQLHYISGVDFNDPQIYWGPFSRVVGRTFEFDVTPGAATGTNLVIGIWPGTATHPTTSPKQHMMWFYQDGNIYCREDGSGGPHAVYVVEQKHCKIVLKAIGAEYWYDGVKIADLSLNNGNTLYIGMSYQYGPWDLDNFTLSLT